MDLEKFSEIKNLLGKDFAALLDVYQSDTRSRFRDIEKAFLEPDLNKIYQLSHAMKSSSANIGAQEVSEIAAIIELAAKSQSVDEISKRLPELKKAIEEA
ncbi:MAG: Hpt domain-containing protein, partial [Asgard group archaeon]|nr:Hpt domain-containing protein [Asgard group archaeon]